MLRVFVMRLIRAEEWQAGASRALLGIPFALAERRLRRNGECEKSKNIMRNLRSFQRLGPLKRGLERMGGPFLNMRLREPITLRKKVKFSQKFSAGPGSLTGPPLKLPASWWCRPRASGEMAGEAGAAFAGLNKKSAAFDKLQSSC